MIKTFKKMKARHDRFQERLHAPLTRKQRLLRIGGAALAGTGGVMLGMRLGRVARAVGALGKEGKNVIPMKIRGNKIKMAKFTHRMTRGYRVNPGRAASHTERSLTLGYKVNPGRAARHAEHIRNVGVGLAAFSPSVAATYGVHSALRGTRFDEKSQRHKSFMASASHRQKAKHHAQSTAIGLGMGALTLASVPGVAPIIGGALAQQARLHGRYGARWANTAYRAWRYRKVKGLPAVVR